MGTVYHKKLKTKKTKKQKQKPKKTKKKKKKKQNKTKQNKKIGSISFHCQENFYISGNKFQQAQQKHNGSTTTQEHNNLYGKPFLLKGKNHKTNSK